MVVMEREADWPLTLVLGVKDGPSHHVNMTHVASSAYIATIPNNVQGRVPFRVECGVSERSTIGSASILIRPRLDQLRLLLEREVSPLAVLCKAVGPLTEAELAESPAAGQDSQVEDLDALLARRLSLSQLPPGLMEILCPEDLGTGAPEISPQSQWPTVLHFAAEFNLEQVCEALLEYPGMLHAACTENCHGLFPCMLAKKGGFHSLHSRLLQYVEDMSASDGQYKRAADSGISFLETLPPPRCRGSLDSSTYVNDTRLSADMGSDVTDDDEFVKQGIMYAKNKARSCSEGCVRTPYARRPSKKRIAEEEDIYDTPPPSSPPPLKPKKVGRARSVVEGLPAAASRLPTPHPHHHLHETPPRTPPRPLPPRPSAGGSHSPEGSGGIQSQLSPDLAEQKRGPSPSPPAAAASSSSSSAASSFPSTAAGEPAEATTKAAAVPGDGQEGGDGVVPRGLMLPASSASGLSLPLQEEDDDTLTEEEAASMRCRTKRSGSLQDKLSLFFHKIKTPRRNRSSSETNLAAFGKGQKKVYVRQSTMSTKSDSTNNSSSSGRFSIVSEHESSERDSGAVCDDTTSTVQLRSKEKNKARCTGKRKGASVKKRMSIRVLRAKNEDLSETPSLPPRPINSSSSNSSQLESTSINLRL